MILIVSHDYIDEPTNEVIDWLYYYKANFRRINGNDFLPQKNLTFYVNENLLIDNKNKTFNIEDISVIWYRRWLNSSRKISRLDEYQKKAYTQEEINLIENYQFFLSSETNVFNNGFFSLFKKVECIPNIIHARGGLNKLDVLINAKLCGLMIPETLLTTSKKEVLAFYKIHQDIITKPISEVAIVTYAKTSSAMFTKILGLDDLELFKDTFFLSLFQKNIEKKFEVRTFVHKTKIFSMAIFSQRDYTTSADFRNYNYENPNRNVPFLIPKIIEEKLLNLFKILNLNTGSVDFIVNPKGDFYFLEINPVGQLGMVSIGGNYHLEKIIAEDLIKVDNEKYKN